MGGKRRRVGIIAIIERLIANGHAYPASNGDVYYAVASFRAIASKLPHW